MQLINTKTQFSKKNHLFSALLIMGSTIGFGQVSQSDLTIPTGNVCDTYVSKEFQFILFNFQDNSTWGNYAIIKPVDNYGNRGHGKAYYINSINGIVKIPLNHGILLLDGYHFTLEEIITSYGTIPCNTDYWIPN